MATERSKCLPFSSTRSAGIRAVPVAAQVPVAALGDLTEGSECAHCGTPAGDADV
jgi:hypothetical protein